MFDGGSGPGSDDALDKIKLILSIYRPIISRQCTTVYRQRTDRSGLTTFGNSDLRDLAIERGKGEKANSTFAGPLEGRPREIVLAQETAYRGRGGAPSYGCNAVVK